MPLKTFDEYVALAEQAHGHICAGQILGLRMALYGLKLLELDDPLGKHRKRLGTFIDRKSTRLNSSHLVISYAGFCVKKKMEGGVCSGHAPDDAGAWSLRAWGGV